MMSSTNCWQQGFDTRQIKIRENKPKEFVFRVVQLATGRWRH